MERERLSKAIQGLRDAFHDLRRQYVMLESRSERHISKRLGVSHAVQEAVGMEHFFWEPRPCPDGVLLGSMYVLLKCEIAGASLSTNIKCGTL